MTTPPPTTCAGALMKLTLGCSKTEVTVFGKTDEILKIKTYLDCKVQKRSSSGTQAYFLISNLRIKLRIFYIPKKHPKKYVPLFFERLI